jgi:CxxC-x17-CxxC domain-containing protein
MEAAYPLALRLDKKSRRSKLRRCFREGKMAFEDKKIACVRCGSEFVFTAGEQQFFQERNLGSEPRRCKNCRARNKARGGRRGSREAGEYRSPAFENSAPDHQKIRSRGRGGPKPGPGRGEYRAPGFRGNEIKPEDEYRAPGFRGNEIKPEDEYRAPGFRGNEINPAEEYRAPGFAEASRSYTDERPMFSIVCAACGKKAMVPFLPEEVERPLCQECCRAEKTAAAPVPPSRPDEPFSRS